MITSNEMEYMKENFLHSSHFSFITVKITFIFILPPFFIFYLIYKYIYLIRLVPLHRIAKIMKDLDSLESYLRGDFANDAQMPGMQISAAVSSAACPAGKVIKVVPGDSSELERTVCSK